MTSNLHLQGAESSARSAENAPSSTVDQAMTTGSSTAKTPSALSRHLPFTNTADIELQPRPVYTPETDPLALSTALKTPEELSAIRANTSRKRNGCGPITLNQQTAKARRLQKFYKGQNKSIERLLKPVDEHIRTAKEAEGNNHLKFQIAWQGSLIANICLALLQVYGAVTSGGSLSIFTTAADAVFDPLSNFMLVLVHRTMRTVDGREFPSGKARFETAGNIFFCFLMNSVSFILIAVSVIQLVSGRPGEDTKSFHLPSVIVVAISLVTKTALLLYCTPLRKVYSQIGILWRDHLNDVAVNGLGLLTSILGSKVKWWIDPMGAIIISLIISYIWLSQAWDEFMHLIGVKADTEMQQWITYISMTHSPMIKAIDTVRAYHSGPRIIVEVDVVIDAHETLHAAHDVAEGLQMKLESLPDVERAYVHIDYETSHKPEHFLKKDL